MVFIYCYLERENYKVLKFHEKNFLTLKQTFKSCPPKGATKSSFQIKQASGPVIIRRTVLKREKF